MLSIHLSSFFWCAFLVFTFGVPLRCAFLVFTFGVPVAFAFSVYNMFTHLVCPFGMSLVFAIYFVTLGVPLWCVFLVCPYGGFFVCFHCCSLFGCLLRMSFLSVILVCPFNLPFGGTFAIYVFLVFSFGLHFG